MQREIMFICVISCRVRLSNFGRTVTWNKPLVRQTKSHTVTETAFVLLICLFPLKILYSNSSFTFYYFFSRLNFMYRHIIDIYNGKILDWNICTFLFVMSSSIYILQSLNRFHWIQITWRVFFYTLFGIRRKWIIKEKKRGKNGTRRVHKPNNDNSIVMCYKLSIPPSYCLNLSSFFIRFFVKFISYIHLILIYVDVLIILELMYFQHFLFRIFFWI